MKTITTVPCELTQERLKELLDYDPKTGGFYWKPIPEKSWQDKMRNARFSGKMAGCLAKSGYRYIRVDGELLRAHRLAWLYVYGNWPKGSLDHINQDPSDNRIENIREATHSENCRNHPMRRTNVSGVAGVYWFKRDKKWRAQINVNGRKIHLGYFDTLDEAASVRREAEKKYGYHKNHGQLPTK